MRGKGEAEKAVLMAEVGAGPITDRTWGVTELESPHDHVVTGWLGRAGTDCAGERNPRCLLMIPWEV